METDFYKDLTPIEKNKNQQTQASVQADSGFYVPIFYSSTQSQSSTQNSAFREAITASHKKVSYNGSWKLIPPTIMQQERGFDMKWVGFLIHI